MSPTVLLNLCLSVEVVKCSQSPLILLNQILCFTLNIFSFTGTSFCTGGGIRTHDHGIINLVVFTISLPRYTCTFFTVLSSFLFLSFFHSFFLLSSSTSLTFITFMSSSTYLSFFTFMSSLAYLFLTVLRPIYLLSQYCVHLPIYLSLRFLCPSFFLHSSEFYYLFYFTVLSSSPYLTLITVLSSSIYLASIFCVRLSVCLHSSEDLQPFFLNFRVPLPICLSMFQSVLSFVSLD